MQAFVNLCRQVLCELWVLVKVCGKVTVIKSDGECVEAKSFEVFYGRWNFMHGLDESAEIAVDTKIGTIEITF